MSMMDRNLERLRDALDGLYDLAIGGTAVGTGLNAHPEFAERAASKVAELTGFALSFASEQIRGIIRRMTNWSSPAGL